MFGYGSLINVHSRLKTVPTAHTAIPVKIMGFERSWSYKCPFRNYTAVSVSRSPSSYINGVLIPLSNPQKELQELDKREYNYARGKVELKSIIPLGSIELPPDSVVWIYETHNPVIKNYSTRTITQCRMERHQPSKQCPIPLSYVDVILSGCLSFGQEFAKEFLVSTKGWCPKSLLNDRHYPLFRSDKDGVDEVLSEVMPAYFMRIVRI